MTLLALALTAVDAAAQTSLYRQKKYYGPIPVNGLSLHVGFVDGPDHQNLTDHLIFWARQRAGEENWENWTTSFYAKAGYQRRISPFHFLTANLNFAYLAAEGFGDYVTLTEPSYYLLSERKLKTYLLSLDIGFHYYMVEPEVRSIAPYIGGGFSGVIPMERLETTLRLEDGTPFPSGGETVSENSLEVGVHGEFGLVYFITNRYSAGMEGRYALSQSKFDIHGGNFDVDYSGLFLSLLMTYYF